MDSGVFIGGIALYMALEYGGEYAVYLASRSNYRINRRARRFDLTGRSGNVGQVP